MSCNEHKNQEVSLICLEKKCESSSRLGCNECFETSNLHQDHENLFIPQLKHQFDQFCQDNSISTDNGFDQQAFEIIQENYQEHKEKSLKDLSNLKNQLKNIDQLIVDLKFLKSQCNDKISDIQKTVQGQLNYINPDYIEQFKNLLLDSDNKNLVNIDSLQSKEKQDKLVELYKKFQEKQKMQNSLRTYYPKINEYGHKNAIFIEGKVIQDSIKLVKTAQEQINSIGSNRVEKLQYEIQSQYCSLSIQSMQKLSSNFICTVSKEYFQIWDLQKREVTQSIRQDNSGCLLKFNEDTLLSACMENIVIFPIKFVEKNGYFIPEIDQMRQQQVIGHEEMVYSLASVDDNRFLSGGFDLTIRLWNIHTKRCLNIFKGHEGRIFYNNIMSQNEDEFVSIDDTGIIKFWNVNQEECIEEREIVPPENEQFQKMSVEDEEDNDTQCLVLKMNDEIFLTSYNNSVQIWSYESKIQTINKNFSLSNTMINEMKRLKNNIFLTVSEDFSAKAWKISEDYQDIKLVETFQDNVEIFSSCKLQDKYVVTGNKDGKVSLWSCGVL